MKAEKNSAFIGHTATPRSKSVGFPLDGFARHHILLTVALANMPVEGDLHLQCLFLG